MQSKTVYGTDYEVANWIVPELIENTYVSICTEFVDFIREEKGFDVLRFVNAMDQTFDVYVKRIAPETWLVKY